MEIQIRFVLEKNQIWKYRVVFELEKIISENTDKFLV